MKLMWSGIAALAFSAVLGAADLSSDDAWVRQLQTGEALAGQGKLAEARKALEAARSQAEAFSDKRLALTLNELGAVDLRLYDLHAALHCFRRSSEIFETHGDQADALSSLTNLAAAYLALGQYSAAETVLRNALPRAESAFGPGDPRTVALEMYLADSAFKRNDYRAAAEWGERILAAARRTHDSTDPVLATALDNLGMIYRAQRRSDASSRLFTEALEVLQRSGHSSDPAWIPALEGAGLTALDARRYAEADSFLERALKRAEEMLGPKHPQTARLLRERAASLRKTGRKAEARPLEARAEGIERQSAKENALGYTVDLRGPAQLWDSPMAAFPPMDGAAMEPQTLKVSPRPVERR